MTKYIFSWDLGATKCSAGIVAYHEANEELRCIKQFTVKLKATTSLDDLIEQLEAGLNFNMHDADAVCIGAAGFYDGEKLILEGVYPYPMPFAQIARQKCWPTFAVIHDYAPIVCATFTDYMQDPANIKRLNTCPIHPQGRRVALGIGTGLGLKDGTLLPNGDFWLGQNEVGHIGISAPPSAAPEYLERHQALISFLQKHTLGTQQQAITFEKILSGQGLVRLYQFMQQSTIAITPEEVGREMQAGNANELKKLFAWYIGLFIGTVQLSFMPEGGIWITGGVALNHLAVFEDLDTLYDGIYASPAYRAQRELYPLGLMCNKAHALIGCGYYASKRLLAQKLATFEVNTLRAKYQVIK